MRFIAFMAAASSCFAAGTEAGGFFEAKVRPLLVSRCLYGLERGTTKGFGWQCLVSRRLAERGVRFVEAIDGGTSIDHNWDAHAFMPVYNKLTGAGGKAYGVSDEMGGLVAEDEVSVHDLQATILNQLGLDHTRLTYRHAGRDYRLTDVHGQVIKGILA